MFLSRDQADDDVLQALFHNASLREVYAYLRGGKHLRLPSEWRPYLDLVEDSASESASSGGR